jgi:hypothetical protein
LTPQKAEKPKTAEEYTPFGGDDSQEAVKIPDITPFDEMEEL